MHTCTHACIRACTHACIQRWLILARAAALGYSVLSLDTDISLRIDPYPLFRGALARFTLIFGLDTDKQTYPAYFPQGK